MRIKIRSIYTLSSMLILLILILDTKTAVSGTQQGLDLCLKTLIPALFPFLIISSVCSNFLSQVRFKWFNILLRPCKLPQNTDYIFITGILSGYPIGAKLINDAYMRRQITQRDANRLLMFCSNAGPSFIFGVLGPLFGKPWIPWSMWFIHIISAYFVGIITAEPPEPQQNDQLIEEFRLTKAVGNTARSMCSICVWVILFRIIITFFQKWFLNSLPTVLQILITGALELSNGCIQISSIENIGIRYMIALLLITFGGLCITLQTAAFTPKLSIKCYLTGKLYQCLISAVLALPLLSTAIPWWSSWVACLIPIFFIIRKRSKKKIVAISDRIVYNIEKS